VVRHSLSVLCTILGFLGAFAIVGTMARPVPLSTEQIAQRKVQAGAFLALKGGEILVTKSGDYKIVGPHPSGECLHIWNRYHQAKYSFCPQRDLSNTLFDGSIVAVGDAKYPGMAADIFNTLPQ
jgi:hypothetical protein